MGVPVVVLQQLVFPPGHSSLCAFFYIHLLIKSVVTCRLCVICVREDISNVC